MKNNVATGYASYSNLSDLNKNFLNHFFVNGFMIQSPVDGKIFLGAGLVKSAKGPFFVDSFYHTKSYHLMPESLVAIERDDFLEGIRELIPQRLELLNIQNSDDDFVQDFEAIQKIFSLEPDLKKIVSVAHSEYKMQQGRHPLGCLADFVKLEGSLYGHWRDGKGVLGVSPEPLYVKQGQNFFVRSLAGTIATDVSNYEYLLTNDKKERYEHQLVIDDICQKLTGKAEELIVGETLVRSFGKMAHLQTDIHFQSAELSSESIVKLLGPTAALGGYPQDLSNSYLRQLSYYKREKEERYFGGVLGLDIEDLSFALVGIRNIFWDSHKKLAEIHSGCGVVRESLIMKELREIRRKRDSIARIFR